MPKHSQPNPGGKPLNDTYETPSLLTLEADPRTDTVQVSLSSQVRELACLILAGKCPAEVAQACRHQSTSPAMFARVLLAMDDRAAVVDGVRVFTGFQYHLEAPGLSRRSVRRAFAVGRAVGVLEGEAGDVYHDRGRFARPPASYCTALPRWVGSARGWGHRPRGRDRTATRALPAQAVTAPPIGVQNPGANVPDFPVHNGDVGPPTDDYRAEVAKMMARREGGRHRWRRR